MGMGGAIGMLGTGMSAMGQMQAGKQSAAASRYNAQLAIQQADATRTSGKLAEYQQNKRDAQVIGMQRAVSAKSGVSFTGSPIMVLKDSLANANLNMMVNRYNTEVEARSYESQAKIDRRMASNAESSGMMSAGATILGGVTKLF